MITGLVLLLASAGMAQVHINENAVITPTRSKAALAGGINRHTLRLEIDAIPQETNQVHIWGPCIDTTTEPHWGSYTIQIDSPNAGLYDFDVTICSYIMKAGEYDNIRLYFDNSLVLERVEPTWGDEGGQGCSCFYTWSHNGCEIEYQTPDYDSWFDFYLGDELISYGNPTAVIVNGYDNCNCRTAWSPHTDPVTLTITSGGQYVSFHRTDPQTGSDSRMGSVVTTVGDSIWQYTLVADGAIPEEPWSTATVQLETDDVTYMASLQIVPPFDHFAVEAYPDSIESSGKTNLYVQAKDFYDEDMWYDGNVQISASPTQYGHLDYVDVIPSSTREKNDVRKSKQVTSIETTSKTGSSKSPSVDNAGKRITDDGEGTVEVSYETAHIGNVFYVADGTVPDTNTTITFTASAVDKPSAKGIGTLVIKGSKPAPSLPPRCSQIDQRWGSKIYDHTNTTIGVLGCALCDMAWGLTAMGYPIDPGQLNDWMNTRSYENGGYTASGDVNWNAISILSAGNLKAFSHPYKPFGDNDNSNKPNILDGYLANGDLVYTQVKDPKGRRHWVTVESPDYSIMDPGFSQTSSLKDDYGKFWSYVVVSKSKGK